MNWVIHQSKSHQSQLHSFLSKVFFICFSYSLYELIHQYEGNVTQLRGNKNILLSRVYKIYFSDGSPYIYISAGYWKKLFFNLKSHRDHIGLSILFIYRPVSIFTRATIRWRNSISCLELWPPGPLQLPQSPSLDQIKTAHSQVSALNTKCPK